jgi:hypothetical protein
MKNAILTLILAFALTGCSAVDKIKSDVVAYTGNDIAVTKAMAEKYNKPQVAKCADFMLVQIAKLQAADTNLEALRSEPTAGLFSLSLKAALIAESLKQLEAVNGPEFKSQFKAACSEVAGDMLFNVMQDAAKIVKR